jgi:hypothetical protein
MAGDDVLLPRWCFLTVTFPQLMQYHAFHAMTGLEEGGGGGVVAAAGHGATMYWMAVGLKLVEKGLILQFHRCD